MSQASTFSLLVYTAPAIDDTSLAIMATRAGASAYLDLAGHCRASTAAMLRRAARFGAGVGVRQVAWSGPKLGELPLDQLATVVLAGYTADELPASIAQVTSAGVRALAEITSVPEALAAQQAGAEGLIARGHEAGECGGAETGFILLQRLRREVDLPVWLVGGCGQYSAAAAVAAGAAGIVLDRQLALTVDSALPESVKLAWQGADGGETTVLGASLGCPVRVWQRPGWQALSDLAELERELAGREPGPDVRAAWLAAVDARLGWRDGECVWPVGQEVGVAGELAAMGRTAAGVIQAITATVEKSLQDARELQPLASGSPLAAALGTEFPIAQGPMTRVSDTAEFAAAVAEGGGLPFLALALLRGEQARPLLAATKAAVGDRAWGVGVLGFVPPELREEQLAAVREFKPNAALIAGGRPSQAKELEADGIPTFLHVPSPRLLHQFVADGARRFVFEGRECGGHIGPRASFLLWDQAVAGLLNAMGDGQGEEFCVLFAGGIHDDVSAAAVSALAAPLAAKGVKIGVQLGTAYLFCREAVECGAVVETFQREALECRSTATIETSPGHAIRVAPTAAVSAFEAKRRELEAEGRSAREIAEELERLNLGRLRVASKGVTRNPQLADNPDAPRYVELPVDEQRRDGLYMIGQLAALRGEVTTIRALHEEVAAGAQVLDGQRLETTPARVQTEQTAIAIVGLSALLPGANDVQTYWENILNGVDSVTEVPVERWDPAVYYDAESRGRGGDKTYSKWGGFLDAIPFDPLAYGIPPRSLATIEPVHLLALEVVRRALEDAGYADRPFRRDRTAVIFGAGGGSSDLSNAFGFRGMMAHFLSSKPGLPDAARLLEQLGDVMPQWCEDTFPGVLINVIAGRIANRFNFGGANFTIDAACASSLAAVDAAVKELRLGHCDVAVAGGADTTQDVFSYLLFANSHVLSPRGRCRPFDEGADGIAISEGVAAVVLKRLEDAERDGDRIYAVIRGVAASSDGRALGLTAPSLDGQYRAVKQAYERAGIPPRTVELVEAHGTGTAVGDRTEVEALSRVFMADGAGVGQVAIGSVKSNIGHTKCAAGLASLIKTSRALYDKVLPPTIGVEQVNARAGFGRNPFFPNKTAQPWLDGRHDHPRRAGVSAFGFGGTNFHCVVEEYLGDPRPRPATIQNRSSELLLWYADDIADLVKQIGVVAGQLQQGATPTLAELAWALKRRLGQGKLAVAVLAKEMAEVPAQLAIALRRLDDDSLAAEAEAAGVFFSARPRLAEGKLAFLMPGQGSQQLAMTGELAVHFPVVAEVWEAADLALLDRFPEGLSRYVFAPSTYDDEARKLQFAALTDTAVAQPALGAAAASMLALTGALGLRPEAVAGHSYGEFAALYAAGAIDFVTLMELSAGRGAAVAETAGDSPGAMAAVFADAERVQAAVGGIDGLVLANLNAPDQTVIAGSDEALSAGLEALSAAGLKAKRLPVACAFHSPLMAPAAERLAALLAEADIQLGDVPVYSNTTAQPHDGTVGDVLAQHLTAPVRFTEELAAMWADGVRVFLEVGPGKVLTGLARKTLAEQDHLAVALDGGVDGLQKALAQLIADGARPSLDVLFDGRDLRRLEPEQLVKQTAPEPLPISAWMVNGGRSWPADGSAVPRPVQAKPASTSAPALQTLPLMPAAELPALPPLPAGAVADDPVIAQFQRGMQQALDQQQALIREAVASQQQLMAQYLESQRAVIAAYYGAPVAPSATAAAVAQPAVEPAAEPEPEVAEPAPMVELDLTAALLELVGERTGYPPDALGLDLDLEADLGVDSIKRIEILGGLQERLPAGAAGDMEDGLEELAQQKSIRQMAAWLEQQLAGRLNGHVAEPVAAVPGPVAGEVRRQRLVTEPCDPGALRELPEGRVVVLAGDAAAIAAMGDLLVAMDQYVEHAAAWPGDPEAAAEMVAGWRSRGPLGGLVWFAAEAEDDGAAEGLFLLAQAMEKDLRGAGRDGFGCLAVTGMGGCFALDGGMPRPADGAVNGLFKALARELDGVTVRAADIAMDVAAEQRAAIALEAGLSVALPAEVGWTAAGWQAIACREVDDETAGELALDADSVVLVVGGARGVTARVAEEVAARSGATLVVVGRTPAPDGQEPVELAGVSDPALVKSQLSMQLGPQASLREIEAAYRALEREREVRANLARLGEVAKAVEYHACDVTDQAAFGALLDDLYARHGRLDAVFCGAGVIADKRLADKPLESFRAVMATKLDAARTLVAKLRPEGLQYLVLFGSVAGRFGNLGQTDYAAANAWLATLAQRLDRVWPTRVVTIDWGPWDEIGMVAPELRKAMASRGVTLLPPDLACELLVAELTSPIASPEVVVAGPTGIGAAAL